MPLAWNHHNFGWASPARKIGMAVKAGAKELDISTVESFKKTLLSAKSIAYSGSASGRYISGELLAQLGIAEQVKDKCRKIEIERVGTLVARGDAEVGFQQISELLPIAGITYVGPIPEEVQKVTVFAAGIPTEARNPKAAKALIRYIIEKGATIIKKTGMEPIPSKK